MKRAFTRIELLIVLAVLGVGAAALIPVYKRVRKNFNVHSSCASNLKQIGLGLLQYTQDYDEHLPPAAMPSTSDGYALGAPPYGWADTIQPYVKSRQLFWCPENEIARPQDSRQPNLTDYYLNSKLAGRAFNTVLKPEAVIAAGEGNDGRELSNARYARSGVPASWASEENSPLLRHPRARDSLKLGAYYLFLDGHVKYLEGTSPPFSFRARLVKPQPKQPLQKR